MHEQRHREREQRHDGGDDHRREIGRAQSFVRPRTRALLADAIRNVSRGGRRHRLRARGSLYGGSRSVSLALASNAERPTTWTRHCACV
jgi:hypothetical protein